MFKLYVRFFLLFALLFVTTASIAQQLYVTDKISIAVYPEADNKSTPIKKLPSGTLVKAIDGKKLSDDARFVQIETKDGITGWIEAIYLTNEKPTQIEYLQLAAKFSAAEAKITKHGYWTCRS